MSSKNSIQEMTQLIWILYEIPYKFWRIFLWIDQSDRPPKYSPKLTYTAEPPTTYRTNFLGFSQTVNRGVFTQVG
jgi:hypothetical protein